MTQTATDPCSSGASVLFNLPLTVEQVDRNDDRLPPTNGEHYSDDRGPVPRPDCRCSAPGSINVLDNVSRTSPSTVTSALSGVKKQWHANPGCW